MKKPDLKVKMGKVTLDVPIVCASGTFGFGTELEKYVDLSSIGSIITKTITLCAQKGNKPPRIAEVEGGVLNSIGLENPGIEGFLKEKLPPLKKIGTKFTVSISADSVEGFITLCRKLSRYREIESLELNLSCPNIQMKKLVSQDERLTYRIVKKAKQLFKRTIIAKLTPEVSDITKIVRSAQNAGADALSLVNTFYGLAINIETKKPYLGNVYGGYSGGAIKPLSLYRVWKAAQIAKITIIGGGGILNAGDAIEFFLAGADIISIGTLNLIYPDGASRILKGIIDYMKKNKIHSIKEFKNYAL